MLQPGTPTHPQERHPGSNFTVAGEIMPDDPGIGEIFAALRRHKYVMLATIVVSLALAGLFLLLITPLYSSETLIMIEPANASVVSIESVVSGLSGDEETIQSEVFVLYSRSLAGRVIRRLKLYEDPEFNYELESIDKTKLNGGLSREFSALTVRFLDQLTVLPKAKSRVISVSFSSVSAEKSATITNTLADEYIMSRLEGRYESTERANDWLGVRIEELRNNVQNVEREIESARARFGLLGGDGITLASRELIELNTQLVMARSERAEAEARLSQVEELSPDRSNNESLNEVLDSNLIQRLREQESEVERRVAELSSEYGERHPKMVQLRAEAQDLAARIDSEIGRIVAGLRSRVAVVKAREKSLQQSLDNMKKQVVVANQNEIELRALEREAEAGRNMLATMLTRQKETLSQGDADYQQADVRVISPADIPLAPAFPRKGVILGLVFVAATILGLVIILIMELLDSGFRSGDELEKQTGVPSIGFIPYVRIPKEYRTPTDYISSKPSTALSEAIRTLNWSISLAFPAPKPKSVLITSSVPGEGKTTVAAGLAISQSIAGRNTVLVDADTKRPTCHSQLGVMRTPGLVDILTGNANLDDVLIQNSQTGLTILPAGSPSKNTPNLLESDQMRELIEELNGRFEFIVIDSPPVMATTDARILCQMTDATVAVIHWSKTRRAVVRTMLNQLRGANARLAGCLLSMVDVKKHAQYGYGDSGAYTGDLGKYYIG
jgi:succinoglycan biosynthesis transport protein ExoP